MGKKDKSPGVTRRSFAPALVGAIAGIFGGAGTTLAIPELQSWYRQISLQAEGWDLMSQDNVQLRGWRIMVTNPRYLFERDIAVSCTLLLPSSHESVVGEQYWVQWNGSTKDIEDAVFGWNFDDQMIRTHFTSDPAIVQMTIPVLKPKEWIEILIITALDVRTIYVEARSETTYASIRSNPFNSEFVPGATPVPEATPQ